MIAAILALGASLCWGFGDLLAGLASRRGPVLSVALGSQLVGLVGGVVVVAAAGRPWPGWAALAPALLAGGALSVGMLAYFRALAVGTMSMVAPIAATAAAIPVGVGLLRGDRPSFLQAAGIAATLVGVVLVSREPERAPAPAGPLEAGGLPAPIGPKAPGYLSLVLSLFAALCFGFVLVGFDLAAESDPLWPPLGGRLSSVILLGVLLARRGGRLLLPRRAVLGVVAAGLFHLSAATLFSLATVRGFLSVVAVLSSMSSVVIVAVAHLALGERLAPFQGLGVAMALAGVFAIVVG